MTYPRALALIGLLGLVTTTAWAVPALSAKDRVLEGLNEVNRSCSDLQLYPIVGECTKVGRIAQSLYDNVFNVIATSRAAFSYEQFIFANTIVSDALDAEGLCLNLTNPEDPTVKIKINSLMDEVGKKTKKMSLELNYLNFRAKR